MTICAENEDFEPNCNDASFEDITEATTELRLGEYAGGTVDYDYPKWWFESPPKFTAGRYGYGAPRGKFFRT